MENYKQKQFKDMEKEKKRKIFKTALISVLSAGAAVTVYINRKSIKNYAVKTWTKVKTKFN